MATIRKATINDFDEILRLNKALFDYEAQFKHDYNVNWPDETAGKDYFKKKFEDSNSLIFVAEKDSRIIGYILAFISTYSYRSINPICEIENMFIEEKYRKKGIGKMLIEKVREEAKTRNVKRLRVGAIVQNEQAIKFYMSQGFSDVNLFLEKKL